MAKKERSYNPAHEQHKKDKKRALDKVKRERQNVQLQHASRRNPATLESQIQNLKQIDAEGRLSDADRAVLATLEKELRLVKRARAQFAVDEKRGPVIVSDKTKYEEAERLKNKEKEEKKAFKEILKQKRDPRKSVYYDEVWNPYGVPPPGMPWKEREEDDSEGWSTDSDVRKIPMPRDTPPPTTTTARKPKVEEKPVVREPTPPRPAPKPKTPEPEVVKIGPSDSIEEAFLRAGATVIEAAPVHRDLVKEAVSLVPSVVKRRPPPSKKPINKVEETASKVVERSLATTVEDEEEEEASAQVSESAKLSAAEVQSPREPPKVQVETLKRPLEVEKEPETKKNIPPPAPPKRRRIVNAAPDV